MPQEKPLHELKNLNGRKLTRRRVMKAAVAAGMSSSAALAMTPEDVKAADSDQVTIPLDVDGETKRQMPADLLDWYYRARDATESIKQGHAHKDAVMTIGIVGPRAGDNPHVLVTLDNSRGNAEERRGELPEKRNGVRVETKKGDETSFEEHDCDADFWDESKKDDFPGGMETSTSDSGGDRITNSSRIYDDGLNWIGWTSCAHGRDCNTGELFYHSDGTQSYAYGEVTDVDTIRDLVFVNRETTPERANGISNQVTTLKVSKS